MAEELRPARRASSPIFISFLPVSPRTNALDLKSALTFSIVRWVVVTRPKRKTMHIENKRFAGGKTRRVAGMALALLLTVSGAARLHGRSASATTNTEKTTMKTASKFYCNTKALNPAERVHHKQLADKLVAARKEIVET